MGKKGYIGESPKDRSIMLMDKFIRKNNDKLKHYDILPGRRKDSDIPVHLWPLKDQIAYYENRNANDDFVEQYGSYPTWYNAVKECSSAYHAEFITMTRDKRPLLESMYKKCIWPKEAARELQKHGVY